MIQTKIISENVSCAWYEGTEGALEYFIMVTSDYSGGFPQSLTTLSDHYKNALVECGLSQDTLVFSRVYLSDVANQAALMRKSPLYGELNASALSIVGQTCLNGGPSALFSYHILNRKETYTRQMFRDINTGANSVRVDMHNYRLLWNAGFRNADIFDSNEQSQNILDSLGNILTDQKMNLLSHTIRSWIYVRDIDNYYKGMVKARLKFFTDRDLTEKTRYLASTGIEGRSEPVGSLVTVDMLSIDNLRGDQIIRMDALDNMPRTIDYGVTFERGLRVRFGDRSHLYISGTASIDKHGNVLHEGNIGEQTHRTIENISALLGVNGGELSDLAHLIVYIRDYHDYATVRDIIASQMPSGLPIFYFNAAVCRPAWLVEMEGVALIPDVNGFPPFM